MVVIYEDHMGMVHVWKGKKCSTKDIVTKGLHNSMTECGGKESDVLIQMNAESWKKRNLTSAQRNELRDGYAIRKNELKDLDDY